MTNICQEHMTNILLPERSVKQSSFFESLLFLLHSESCGILTLDTHLNCRYRSNSLDSILVADLDQPQVVQSVEHLQEMVAVHHHSQRPHASSATYHVYKQQHHFIPKTQMNRKSLNPGNVRASAKARPRTLY